ncbi:hypothetical protein [Streptomyces sp. NPDC048644]|uniref:hypothetical protein n=1 Tax=Streptomyces sp. NPDC048644 TaxID=3365582 RepID=UPI0037113453
MPAALRDAVEAVVGPLADAAHQGPVAVCHYCDAPTRSGIEVDALISESGPGLVLHACRTCWRDTARGGDGRHLRLVRPGAP